MVSARLKIVTNIIIAFLCVFSVELLASTAPCSGLVRPIIVNDSEGFRPGQSVNVRYPSGEIEDAIYLGMITYMGPGSQNIGARYKDPYVVLISRSGEMRLLRESDIEKRVQIEGDGVEDRSDFKIEMRQQVGGSCFGWALYHCLIAMKENRAELPDELKNRGAASIYSAAMKASYEDLINEASDQVLRKLMDSPTISNYREQARQAVLQNFGQQQGANAELVLNELGVDFVKTDGFSDLDRHFRTANSPFAIASIQIGRLNDPNGINLDLTKPATWNGSHWNIPSPRENGFSYIPLASVLANRDTYDQNLRNRLRNPFTRFIFSIQYKFELLRQSISYFSKEIRSGREVNPFKAVSTTRTKVLEKLLGLQYSSGHAVFIAGLITEGFYANHYVVVDSNHAFHPILVKSQHLASILREAILL